MKRKRENKKKTEPRKTGHHTHPLPDEINAEQSKQNANAHHRAEKDMTDDAEFVARHK